MNTDERGGGWEDGGAETQRGTKVKGNETTKAQWAEEWWGCNKDMGGHIKGGIRRSGAPMDTARVIKGQNVFSNVVR